MNETSQTGDEQNPEAEEFQRRAQEPRVGLAREFLDFLRENKKWWLAPIIVVLLLLGLLVVLSSTGAAPFMYPF